MNIKKLIYRYSKKLIGEYPKCMFFRKMINKAKYGRYKQKCIQPDTVKSAEENYDKKNEIVKDYILKNENSKNLIKMIDKVISKTPDYSNRTDDSVLKTEMLFCYIAYGFLPEEFVYYELEHKSYDERKSYISDRDLMMYVWRMNDFSSIQVFNDKAETYKKFSSYYMREVIHIESEADLDAFVSFAKLHHEFVAKSVGAAMGRGVQLIDLWKCEEDPEKIFLKLIKKGKYVIEEKVQQSEEFARFNSSSVNTIRVVTFNTKEGVVIPYSFFRIGRSGSFVDNGGSGGVLAGINVDTGCIDTDGYDEYTNCYKVHPDSKVPLKGTKMPDFDKALCLAKKMAEQVPAIKYIGWDFAHTDKGWIVIEGNGAGQPLTQILYKKGIKQEYEDIMKGMDLFI